LQTAAEYGKKPEGVKKGLSVYRLDSVFEKKRKNGLSVYRLASVFECVGEGV
jgi:hypothetical protein